MHIALDNSKNYDTIYIAGGYYDIGNDKEISLDKSLSIYGGYSRDFNEITGYTHYDGKNVLEHIISISPECDIRLENMIISGGKACKTENNKGGGIFNEGTLHIENSSIINNSCTNTAGGGGIYNTGNISLNNCIISNNSSLGDGGGLYSNSKGFVNISNSNFSDNSSLSGSALFIKKCGNCYIAASSFSHNKSQTYGTITFYNKDFAHKVTIVNTTIANNYVIGHTSGKTRLGGSAIYCYGNENSDFGIVNNTVIANMADARDSNGDVCKQLGGAIVGRQGTVNIYNNVIAGNLSQGGFGDIYIHSGAKCNESKNIITTIGNTNITVSKDDQYYASAETAIKGLENIFDLDVINDSIKAILSNSINNVSKYIKRRGTLSNPLIINNLSSTDIEEKVLNIDLNNNGVIDGYLMCDQLGRSRSMQSTCTGAIEYDVHNSSMLLINKDLVTASITDDKINITSIACYDVTVFDINGKALIPCKTYSGDASVIISHLQSGYYILKISTSGNNIITKKFFKP